MSDWSSDDDGMIFFFSVDGTHCKIDEPSPFSPQWSSYKLGGHSGVNYEIGLRISKPHLCWVHGPEPAGKYNDLSTFCLPGGFRDKVLQHPGKRGIADNIYIGPRVKDIISNENEVDPRELAAFKERVLSRHEKFNSCLKSFGCLNQSFRHGFDMHGKCFRAVCAIVMHQIAAREEEGVSILFDPYP